jgi:hypothetical protein
MMIPCKKRLQAMAALQRVMMRKPGRTHTATSSGTAIMSITNRSNTGVHAINIVIAVRRIIQWIVNFLINRKECRSFERAVEVANRFMIGLSMVTERLTTIPMAASITTSLGNRFIAALTIGPSEAINSQLA